MNAPLASADLRKVEALITSGRFPEADLACGQILARDAANPAALYYRAYARVRARRYDEARRDLEQLIGDRPAMSAPRYLLADAETNLGRFASAAEAYAVALALDFSLDPSADLPTRVASIVDFLASAPVERWTGHSAGLTALGRALEKSGLDLGASGLASRLAASALPLVPDTSARTRLAAAFAVLAANPQSSAAWRGTLVEGVLLPWMRRALAAGQLDTALEIENEIYFTYVVTTENQEHFRASFGLWQDDMREAGQRYGALHPLPARAPAGKLPRIAFFVHNVTMLAHATALIEVLEGHAELEAPLMEPWLFCLSGSRDAVDRFARANVRIVPLMSPAGEPRFATALTEMRRRIAVEGIDVLAWISLAVSMPFAFGMRSAPRQVWWAMKYHALEFDEIDDYVTGGGETGIHEIQGRPWRVGPVVAGKWVAPELAGEARRVHDALGARGIVYGCFGRTEKLNSPVFLDAVVAILRATPDALFLWTGRAPDASIQGHFERAGVADRCRFIGWVNTKLYAQVIDVFLDSFPFPAGFTLYEAMAAGKPAVLFASAESEHGGINAIVGSPLAADPTSSDEARIAHAIFRPAGESSLYLRAANPGQYVEFALALARDPAYRERVGRAAREFIEKLMTDRRRAARIYVDHLVGREIGA